MRLGLRTGLNTIEKLPCVAQSKVAILGVFHKPYVQKYIKIFANRYERFGLVKGNEGTPEVFSKTRLWIYENAMLKEYRIDPAEFGINYTKSWERISIEESLQQLKNPSKEFIELAKLNASIWLFVAKKANSVEEAFMKLS